VIIIGIIVII